MIKLNRFYDLLSRSAHVTLLAGSSVLFEGPVKSIPDEFDNRVVSDFRMNDDGSMVFVLEV